MYEGRSQHDESKQTGSRRARGRAKASEQGEGGRGMRRGRERGVGVESGEIPTAPDCVARVRTIR